MPTLEVDVSAALNDALVVDWAVVISPTWGKDILPRIDSLFYSAAASLAVEIYQAPDAASALEDRIPLATVTATTIARSCYPIWVDPTSREPWTLRMTKPAGAAVLRIEWSRNGGGL